MADKKMELIVKVNVSRTGAAVAATSVNTAGILVTDSVLTGKSEHNDYRYAGEDEVIEIRHTAYSRAIFAKGAMEAARFLAGKPAGLYTMQDVIG